MTRCLHARSVVASLVLFLVACDQPTRSIPVVRSSTAYSLSVDSTVIRPVPSFERSHEKTRDSIEKNLRLLEDLAAHKRPVYDPSNYDHTPPPNAPRFQSETVRSCSTCYGVGGLVVAVTPSRKSAEAHAVALRSLVAYYKGAEWNRHLTTVPWFGDRYALLFANTFTKPAEDMCVWLKQLGWGYGSGLPGHRVCWVYRVWPPERP